MAQDAATTAGSGRGNWRRKWRRAPAAKRRQAAGTLGDIFAARKARGGPVLVLLVVLAGGLHAGLLPLVETGQPRDIVRLTGRDSYLRKVVQTERAKHVARGLTGRITMPPPPPVPESVVNTTLAAEITTDIERVIGAAMDVKVTSELAREVTGSLREELAAAARSIADGKLTAKQIRDLQEDFRRRAHRRTVTALRKYRERTQVARAKMSVKEWYEQKVSKTLRGRLDFELFKAGHAAWGRYGGAAWGFLDERAYAEKLDRLRELARGEHYGPHSGVAGRPTQHNRRLLPDWPKPTGAQARGLLTVLRTIHERPARGWTPAWDEAVATYIDDCHPHRRREMAENHVKELAALWTTFFNQARQFLALTESGADEGRLAGAQKAWLATAAALRDRAARLCVSQPKRDQLRALNQALRSRVLRGPHRDKAYNRLVDALVGALAPAVRDMAENEFGEGIIIRKKGVDTVASEFAGEILELLRRDVQKAFPKPRFDDRVFDAGLRNPYRSEVDGKPRAPTPAEVARDEAALSRIVGGWAEPDRAYVPERTEVLAGQFHRAVGRVIRAVLGKIIAQGRLAGRSYGCPPSLCFYHGIDSVDYTDEVAQRLDARARALAGRGQDLARLTEEGIPDASAPMIALMLGAAGGHGASLEPVLTAMVPGHLAGAPPAGALRPGPPRLPPPPRGWGRLTQPEVLPHFKTYRCEGIPFLANLPRLDGRLTDWGKIRPLVTQRVLGQGGPDEAILLYAAWNYQGFFFGYHVTQPAAKWGYPTGWYQYKERAGVIPQWAPDYHWAYRGEFLRLLFDTLDARGRWRGEPHTQEFVIFPRGTEMHPSIPGIERIISSVRDASRRGVGSWMPCRTRIFPPQPAAAEGPDGTGPFRVTRFTDEGYTTEVFLPRSLFNVPVFCPGWYVGFEVMVGTQVQSRYHCAMHGRIWANPRWHGHGDLGDKDHPDAWGDLLLLGTDPHLAVQAAGAGGEVARGIVPGHSYLLTVIDPDRNIHLTAADTVVVSAEVIGGTGSEPVPGGTGLKPVPTDAPGHDMEVFILKETHKNTSVFRGYVNTQPGTGRKVQAVLELLPGQRLRLGYVDLADARGQRNLMYHLELPVLAGVATPLARAP